ncbi:aminotransferase class IV [Henriciella marina]|uniref:Probable branched-chain-amino-acid aminotransferase n=1 Tax=Henriciella marina TaxID=453851 RepID=A0ABT4LSY1_9PROT|nr:aminotransferase class IV [Henriciella marina]MCZ4297471.1 aminotransferase class IV [Henriciella marina]
MQPADIVYLNGEYVKKDEACLSPFDRGFLFAHAAYEVTAVFGGKLIDFDAHMARLVRTLDGIDIPRDVLAERLKSLHEELISLNGVTEGFVYLQVTGGAYGRRDFGGPETLVPGLFLFCETRNLIGDKARYGVSAITVEDQRWKRRDYKTTQLLSQALAYREAERGGAFGAILHEDGMVTEAASANLWVVRDAETLVTRNLGRQILPGITRQSVLDHMGRIGMTVEERVITLDELKTAREVFTTSATGLVLPVVELDGKPVGVGKPGPVTRRVQGQYYRGIGADIDARAPWLNEV